MSEKNFVWDSSLAVGHESIDEEHKDIIDRMKRLTEMNNKTFNKELLIITFDDLIRCTNRHFLNEEDHMRRINYPQFENHQKIHQSFVETLLRYRQEMINSVYHRFPSSVFDFFKTWITTHILIVDKQYAEFEIQQAELAHGESKRS
jgi:hemerythrin-like metal-binding protein